MPGGRPKGALNKATAEVKVAARAYTDKALKTLAKIMENTEANDGARVAAANALLDRGHGKPAQAIVGSDDEPPIRTVIAWQSDGS